MSERSGLPRCLLAFARCAVLAFFAVTAMAQDPPASPGRQPAVAPPKPAKVGTKPKPNDKKPAIGIESAASELTREITSLGGHFLVDGSAPSWSPSGHGITYCRGDELRVFDLAENKSRSLGQSGRSPAWSPSGRYIAYCRGPKGKEEVCVLEAAGGAPERIAAGIEPHWSADGGAIVYSTGRPLKTLSIPFHKAGSAKPIAPNLPSPSGRGGSLSSAPGLVTDDGRRAARRVGDRLQILDPATGKGLQEWWLAEPGKDQASWSPDSRLLACCGLQSTRGVVSGIIDAEEGRLFRIARAGVVGLAWSRDSSKLAIEVAGHDGPAIWSLETSAVKGGEPMAPACPCAAAPQAGADVIGPWHCPQGKLAPIDLSHQANWSYLKTTPTQVDNNLSELPPGPRSLAGVEFQIASQRIQLRGKNLANLPKVVEGISVGRRVVRLFILHGVQYAQASQGVKEGDTIAEYRLRYADGDRATVPVVVGRDIRDWWGRALEPVTKGQVAWVGSNKRLRGEKTFLRLYLTTWINPYPEKTVDSIGYAALHEAAAPFCIAITAEEPRSVSSSGPAGANGSR
jgi:Tol biopolymer transport system component